MNVPVFLLQQQVQRNINQAAARRRDANGQRSQYQSPPMRMDRIPTSQLPLDVQIEAERRVFAAILNATPPAPEPKTKVSAWHKICTYFARIGR